jgi:hypothetical protein
LLTGRLYGDPTVGCIWIGRPRGGAEIDWPSNVSVEFNPIRVSGLGWVAHQGDWFRIAGGTDPRVTVTKGCPVPEPGMGKFVPDTIEYFGGQRPSAELDATSGATGAGAGP